MDYLTYFLVFLALIIIFIILYKIFRFLMSLLLIAVFVLIAYLTNPSEEKHRRMVLKKADDENISMKKKAIKREDYYVVSLTGISEGDDHRIIGAGAFTQVYLFSKP